MTIESLITDFICMLTVLTFVAHRQYRFFFIFSLESAHRPQEFCEKIVRFEQNAILKTIFEQFQSCRHFGSPSQRSCDAL